MIRLAFGLSLMFCTSTPAFAAWRVAESAHFRVYADMSADLLRRRVELLEDYRNLLGRFTTAQVDDSAPKLDVYIVENISSAVPFGKIGPDVAGFYNAGDRGIAAFATKGDFGKKVLLHEYAHHHMFASTGQSYPGWYVEGFAEYFMTATFYPTRVDFGGFDLGRAYALSRPWLPWDRVIGRDNSRMSSDDTQMFYAQSWLLTHYLFRAPGMREKLNAHLLAVAGGTDPLAAFKAHVLPATNTLHGTLKAYTAKLTFSRLTRKAPKPVAVSVRDLPASAGDVLMFYAWLDNRGGVAKDGKAALARVQAATARYPDDGLATRTLAMAEVYWGDAEKAGTLLDGLLKAAPDDAEVLRLKAEVLLKIDATAKRSEARRLLVQAVRAAPADWRAMHIYVHTQDLLNVEMGENLSNLVQRMWELAPQVDGIAIDMATVLVRKGRAADAAKVLEPAAFAPHGGNVAAFAGRLRDAALAGDAAAYGRVLTGGPPKEPDEAAKDKAALPAGGPWPSGKFHDHRIHRQ